MTPRKRDVFVLDAAFLLPPPGVFSAPGELASFASVAADDVGGGTSSGAASPNISDFAVAFGIGLADADACKATGADECLGFRFPGRTSERTFVARNVSCSLAASAAKAAAAAAAAAA